MNGAASGSDPGTRAWECVVAGNILHTFATAVDAQDLPATLACFREDAVLATPRGESTGLDEIGAFFMKAWATDPSAKRHFVASPRTTWLEPGLVRLEAYFSFIGRLPGSRSSGGASTTTWSTSRAASRGSRGSRCRATSVRTWPPAGSPTTEGAGMLGAKRILITGAAQGMGREIALEATRQGASHIGLTDANGAGIEETAALVRELGGDALCVVADLRVGAEIEQMIDQVADWAGGLDVLVNNAGVLDQVFTDADRVGVDTLDEEAWDAVNDINLKAVWLATKYAAPHLRKSDRGPSIVNAASVSGMTGAGMAAYAVTKAAVIQLTRTTAINLAPTCERTPIHRGRSRPRWATRTWQVRLTAWSGPGRCMAPT